MINICSVWYCQRFHHDNRKCEIPLKHLSEDIRYAVGSEVSSIDD